MGCKHNKIILTSQDESEQIRSELSTPVLSGVECCLLLPPIPPQPPMYIRGIPCLSHFNHVHCLNLESFGGMVPGLEIKVLDIILPEKEKELWNR